jgi:hypothetical protein
MRFFQIVSTLIVSGAFATTAATAGEGCQGGTSIAQHIFEMADADEDGLLSQDEYDSANLGHYGVDFVATDTDESGMTSLDEYLDLYRRIHTIGNDLEV